MTATSDPTSTSKLLGRTIGARYRIEELIGGGAMGDVYRAKHVGLGTDVAVKIMRPSVADDSKFKERFYREAKAASRLVHANSVRVMDFGQEDDGLVYLIMEYLRGRDLLAILQDEWPLSDERIVDILSQTLAALSVAHGNGIVHRDLKPENIMIVPDEDDDRRDCVKVCDFGIAKLTDARAFKSNEDVTTALTVGHALIGTPEYMSPEQARGDALDARADLYALGVVLYRMLTGKLPFEAENVIGLAVKQIMEQPKPPSMIQPNVNPRLEAICLRAMKKDPADRYASAKEMRTELRAVLTAVPAATSTPSLGTRASASSMPIPSGHASTNPVSSGSGEGLGGAGVLTMSDGFLPRSSRDQSGSVRVAQVDVRAPTYDASSGDPSKQIHDEVRSARAAHANAKTNVTGEPAPVVPLHGGSGARIAVFALLALLAGAGVWLIIDSQRKHDVSNADKDKPTAPSSSVIVIAPLPTPTTTILPVDTPSARVASHAPTGPSATPNNPTTNPNGTAVVRTTPSTTAASSRLPVPTSPLPSSAPTASATAAPTTSAAPQADYKPTNAFLTIQPLMAERVQREPIQKKIADITPQLNNCYRDALFMVGAPVGGNAEIQMSGRDRLGRGSVVIARQLPPFQRCASQLLSGMTVPASTVESGGGTATQILKLNP